MKSVNEYIDTKALFDLGKKLECGRVSFIGTEQIKHSYRCYGRGDYAPDVELLRAQLRLPV
ncbi:MAG: hypothetical protein U5N58_00395 [Actinomycetota bacterium]|nr:hypothetical protein [Actinomycetota bacterium]